MDPQNEKRALVHAITDRDGNAVLTVSGTTAKKVDKRDTALEILSPAGKTLVMLPSAVCVRLKQVETKVVTLHDSPEIGPQQSAALQMRAEREARLSHLASRIDALKREREVRLHDLDCRLEDNEAIVSELEPQGGSPRS